MKGSYEKLNKTRNMIIKHQNGDFHPLTCGNDSQNHSPLVTSLQKNGNEFELIIVCNDCSWKQDVPKFFTLPVIEDGFF
jgi:hypothetical protein